MSLADVAVRPAARQLLRFAIVGVANTLLTYAVIWLLHDGVGTSVALASALGYVAGMIQGFVLSRLWTFAGVDHAVPVAVQVVGFIVVNLICGTLFTQANVVLSRSLPLLVSSLLATALVVPLSFALNRWVVFRARA